MLTLPFASTLLTEKPLPTDLRKPYDATADDDDDNNDDDDDDADEMLLLMLTIMMARGLA